MLEKKTLKSECLRGGETLRSASLTAAVGRTAAFHVFNILMSPSVSDDVVISILSLSCLWSSVPSLQDSF